MALTTRMQSVGEASRELGDFYVPGFEVRIDGPGLPGRLPRSILRDVFQVTYKDDVNAIDSIELQVNNWDEESSRFAYVGSEEAGKLEPIHRIFEPCNREFRLHMGYMPELTHMMTGTFTSMEPRFPSTGRPTLTVRGLNVLHQLRRKQYTHAWTEKKESEIARSIQGLRDRQTGRKRFPLPIEVSRNAMNDETPIEYIAQENQYDVDFLLGLARRRGYELVVREVDGERKLYFGPSDPKNPDTRITTYTLEWGKSLIDFTPTLTTANQVGSVTVNGWDRAKKRPISETVRLDDRRIARNEDLHETLERCDPREEQVVSLPVFTKHEARRRAEAILRERQKDLVKASGTTVGLPNLRAGLVIAIDGIGARFSGKYYVTQTTHTIDDKGYVTRFKARRESA